MGTPGRLDDLISTGKLSLSQVRFLVLDECVSTEPGLYFWKNLRELNKTVFFFSPRMVCYPQVIQILSTGSTIKSRRSLLMAKGCRYRHNSNTPGQYLIQSHCDLLISSLPGHCLLSNSAFIRCEEVVRAHHALPNMGGSEGGGLCPRDRPPCGRTCKSQIGSPVGAPGQESHSGK